MWYPIAVMLASGNDDMKDRLLSIFDTLLNTFGRREWWPGDTPLEIMVGAVLTQNTSWKNVEKAIASLKEGGVMSLPALHEISHAELARLIRSSGFYNIKAGRLKNLVNVIYDEYNGNISHLKSYDAVYIRRRLLAVDGIGKETADSIVLYALEKPVFVIDAYTKRFAGNHGLLSDPGGYDELQSFFIEHLPLDTYLFNEYHALIVCLCQQYCRKVPQCRGCPLESDLSG